jgi:hypothetical protein
VLADPEGIATPFYPTVFMNLHGIGFNYSAAMAAQVCFAAAAVAAVAWAFRTRADADRHLLFALFVSCSITAVPYLLVYDTLALCFAALLLLDGNRLDRTGACSPARSTGCRCCRSALANWTFRDPGFIAPVFALYIVQQLRTASAHVLRPTAHPVRARNGAAITFNDWLLRLRRAVRAPCGRRPALFSAQCPDHNATPAITPVNEGECV